MDPTPSLATAAVVKDLFRTASMTELDQVKEHLWSSLAIVFIDDATGQIIWASPALERMFGYGRRGELTEKKIEVLVPEAFREGHVALRAGYSANPQPRSMGARRAIEGQRKDGTRFPVAITLDSFRGDSRNINYAVVVDLSAHTSPSTVGQSCPFKHE